MKVYPIAISSVVGILVACGCIKRTETVAVLPDGSALLLTQIEGDPEDFENGDPLPSQREGWSVKQHTIREASSKQTKHYLTAKRKAPVGAGIPDSYASASDPVADICLRFPTDITIDRQRDGIYYHYQRVYEGREFAQVNYWRDAVLENDDMKKIQSKSPEELTPDERMTLAAGLIKIESLQAAEFLKDAAIQFADRIGQHQWLLARAALMETYESEGIKEKVSRMLESDNSDIDGDALAEETRALAEKAMRKSLRENGVSPIVVNELIDAYYGSRERFEITQDIADEDWTHIVILPGTIIAHNSNLEAEPVDLSELRKDDDLSEIGDALSAGGFEHGYGIVKWSFDAKALCDRDVVLAATSFVPNSK